MLTGRGRKILEEYPEQQRCLVLGSCAIGRRTRLHLHVVCDLSDEEVLDIVTVFPSALATTGESASFNCAARLLASAEAVLLVLP